MEKIFKGSYLQKTYPDKIELISSSAENLELAVSKELLKETAAFFKESGYGFLADISSVDYKEYFEVIYQLYSFDKNESVTLVVKIEDREDPQVQSLTGLWPTADWHEREVFDLMGIKFTGHPNLKRILMWEGFKGHPLRKDFPKVERKRSWEG